MNRFTYIIFLAIFLFNCNSSGNKKLKTIEIGDYEFDFPSDFELKEEKGVDSYVGRIKGDSMQFGFDFGYYTSRLIETPEEYLLRSHWKIDIISALTAKDIRYRNINPFQIEVKKIVSTDRPDTCNNCDYVAFCKYSDLEFNFPIQIPQEIKEHNFIVDTIGNLFRKIVYPKETQKGVTGIYIRATSFNTSMNNYLALVMSAKALTKEEQELALKIYFSGRQKQNRE